MINHSTATLDATFAALADPVRRRVLIRLGNGEASVSELAAEHAISLPAFLKHVRVLELSGALTTRKEGRVRWCRADPNALTHAAEWIEWHRSFWEGQLDSLERHIGQSQEDSKWTPRKAKPRIRSNSAVRSVRRKPASTGRGRKPKN